MTNEQYENLKNFWSKACNLHWRVLTCQRALAAMDLRKKEGKQTFEMRIDKKGEINGDTMCPSFDFDVPASVLDDVIIPLLQKQLTEAEKEYKNLPSWGTITEI